MLISDTFIDLLPLRTPAPPRLSKRRIAGYALSLILHGLLLMHLLRPAQPMAERIYVDHDSGQMSLVLIESPPIAPLTPDRTPTTSNRRPLPAAGAAASASTPLTPRRRKKEAMAAVFPDPPSFGPSAAQAHELFDDIEQAAAQIVAQDKPLPNAGMPSAIGRVPGRAEEFIHLPLRHQQGGAVARAIGVITKHMILGDLPEDRLRGLSERSGYVNNGGEPVCNDPENPVADKRCWEQPDD